MKGTRTKLSTWAFSFYSFLGHIGDTLFYVFPVPFPGNGARMDLVVGRYKRPSSFAMYLLRWNSIKFCAKWSEEPLKFNISRGIICIMEWIKWNGICMQNSKIHCWTVSILHYRTTLGNNRWCASRNQNSIVDQYGIAGESRFRIHYTPTHHTGGIPINNYTQGDKGQPFLIDSVTLLICFTTIEEIRLNCEVAVYGGVRMLCCNGTLVY